MPNLDTIFDLAEGALAAFGEASGIPGEARDGARCPTSRTPGHPPRPAQAASASASASASRALARTTARASFRVDDVIDAETGRAVYVVTNGRDRAECSSREFAERVRSALG